MARTHDWEPIPERFARALTLGALAGGVLTPVWLAISFGSLEPSLLVSASLAALCVWTFGLWFVGFPIWVALHEHGYRSRRVAMGLGIGILLPAFFLTSSTPEGIFRAAGFVAMGPMVGWIVWRVTYGGQRP